MLTHLCTSCSKRQIIFPTQFTAVTASEQGPVATFDCWCGAEQSAPLGWAAAEPRKRVLAA
ncbi:hypothetical protein I601_1589 [Nocardioides dokdonensis FR1436]|uniref:Uncharacterized protein n=1 Tax=Nocardioides dokdonensis FR1436 TaxID=1300347 RepID=A0A1A9GK35_9ACTN|nr:hypothetical protein [Nocardioides dokdonensis]ANH38022.1 hypothetical protein I601_1589 [Nocardioides dokdonensis FR1436]